jgi:hypothetical protein
VENWIPGAAGIEAEIRRSLGDFDPAVEESLFDGIRQTADAVAQFSNSVLGSPVHRCLFYSSHAGAATGLELEDGRRLVVKAHQPWMSDAAHLAAVVSVQKRLLAAGFPCPRPLLGPVPLGRGFATVDELLQQGEELDAREPRLRVQWLPAYWDSLGAAPEAFVAANAAAHFTATWDMPVARVWPTAADREAFLKGYEAARGHPFTRYERRVVDAAVMYQLAYTSRVEHSVSSGPWPEDSCRHLLAELPDIAQ